MEYELYHHGVKGMKWGIRHDKKSIRSSKIKKTHKDLKTTIERGKKHTKNFLRKNGPMLLKTSAVVGLSAIGLPQVAVGVNIIGSVATSSLEERRMDNAAN